jgi:hypothetical protein
MPWYEVLGLAVIAWFVVPYVLVAFSFLAACVFDYRASTKH